MAAGESSVSYSIVIPNSVLARRGIYGECYHTAIYQDVYYNSSGSQWYREGAQLLTGGRDYASINMIFFLTKTITGTITLPGGDLAPPGGYNPSVFAYSEPALWPIQDWGSIPGGAPLGTYSVTVPADPNANWRVSYYWYEPGYFPQGFYTGSTTHWNPESAQLLTGGTDHANINLAVLASADVDTISVSGKLSMPPGRTAPDSTATTILISNPYYPDNYFQTVAVINQGESWGPYTLEVSSDASINWLAWYPGGGIYVSRGYYRGSKTVCTRNNAFPLNGGSDHSSINLTLLRQCESLVCFPVQAQNNSKATICF